ncbi:glutamate/tyrosine decarboxylase-like PLP-dependent enzyme [Melghiribacillus thermohalophilus]|uniref:Glutamate/tyrosine decarboxylase-like PLP-dependent enzyme n=1 Tax=Melghiribacillus thermohalophilus TaxID=1324956 RepID=A0A4R3MU11_9BACI|nr:pyridoxal-dependent decarboxylase [Melghiribacillus thermohalophilus]TCT18771.1 glutamate/tyrosine decarboxylase-like PLP-dependent enzyme [Melghiribacillus thermohalophilus]
MKDIQQFFPSIDGNLDQRNKLIGYIKDILNELDELKDPDQLTLGEIPDYKEDHYNQIIHTAEIPRQSIAMEKTIHELLNLAKGHRYINRNYVANAAPLPSIPAILGNLLMILLNGNNLWDVESSGASRAEVAITSMLSKLIGLDPHQSAGYTTWGGQGAVFHSLRLAIARHYPESNKQGIPDHLYCFCSELSHYSLYKSMEATGIGVDHLIRVKTNDDHSINIDDLKKKMIEVISRGGVPIYVLATMGTTDTFGIDDLKEIKNVTDQLEKEYGLDPVYIHADSAMGGMYAFFNEYDFESNPLELSLEAHKVLKAYQEKFRNLCLADSLVFDFHKLGQTPYASSLFMIKDKELLKYVDLDHDETPYVGNRSFGSYHTSYTLECSRMGSSIPIYASLLALGVEGYQKILANYIEVNISFRNLLQREIPNAAITNDVSPVTTFRFYPDEVLWKDELNGRLTRAQIEQINKFNEKFGEILGQNRQKIYFGGTRKQRFVQPVDYERRMPIYAHKFFSISPYTTVDEVERYVQFLKEMMDVYQKELAMT